VVFRHGEVETTWMEPGMDETTDSSFPILLQNIYFPSLKHPSASLTLL
jgi:hypothetical protein